MNYIGAILQKQFQRSATYRKTYLELFILLNDLFINNFIGWQATGIRQLVYAFLIRFSVLIAMTYINILRQVFF
jgi:hypothetical protein